MIIDEAFHRMIREQPAADGPRLVYADWLEEQGLCERAELIREQCTADLSVRADELIRDHGIAWAGPIARHAYSYAYRRGFVEELTISGAMLLEYGDELFDFAPIRLLRIIGARPMMDRLMNWPRLAQLEALHLTGGQIGDEGAARLAGCQYLTNLHTLRLGGNSLSDDGVESLVDSPALCGLRVLTLHGNLIGDAGAQVLAGPHQLGNLEVLDLSDNLIGDAGAEALASSFELTRLTRLDLSNQFKGWSAGLALRGRPYPIQPIQQERLTARYGPSVCVF